MLITECGVLSRERDEAARESRRVKVLLAAAADREASLTIQVCLVLPPAGMESPLQFSLR
jgi:hypothetical protein